MDMDNSNQDNPNTVIDAADEKKQLLDLSAAAAAIGVDDVVHGDGDNLFSQFADAIDLTGALGPPPPETEPSASPAADKKNLTSPSASATVDKNVSIPIPVSNLSVPGTSSTPTDKPKPTTPTAKPKPKPAAVVEDSSMFALVLKEIQSNEKKRAIAKAAAAVAGAVAVVAAPPGQDKSPLCLQNTTSEDYVKNKRKYGLSRCFVIVSDVLKLSDKVLHRNDADARNLGPSPSLNRKRIVINGSGMKELQQLELSRRVYYRKKLKRALKRGLGLGQSGKVKVKVKGSSGSGGKVKVKVEGGHHHRDKEEHKKDGYKTQLQLEHERSKKLEELKRKTKAEKFSAGGTRILDFERRHDSSSPQHHQLIKRPKMKETETTSKPGKNSQHHSTLQAVKHAPPPPPASFRMPYAYSKREKAPPALPPPPPRTPIMTSSSSPFTSYNAPRENTGYQRERFRKDSPFQNKWTADSKAQKWDFNFKLVGHYVVEPEEDDDCEEVEPPPPPPISEVDFGQMIERVNILLAAGADEAGAAGLDLNLPPSTEDNSSNSSDFLAQKYAWWFRTMEKDPIRQHSAVNPEVDDVVFAEPRYGYDYTGSSIGNVSDAEGDGEISYSTNQNPAITDEFCGCQLLGSKYRISADSADGADGEFASIFLVRPGSNYEKESFQAKCNVCETLVNGKAQLGPHVRSGKHRENMKNLSLKLIRKRKSKSSAEDKQTDVVKKSRTQAEDEAGRKYSKDSVSTLERRIAKADKKANEVLISKDAGQRSASASTAQHALGEAPWKATSRNRNTEFDGFDLVEVLQIILDLVDQLKSTSDLNLNLDLDLVSKVRAYHKTAEELESSELLERPAFVSLLTQVRDRFEFDGLIQPKLLPAATLTSLNFCVYLLNKVLGTATCQRVNRSNSQGEDDGGGVTLEQKRGIVNLLAGNLMEMGNVAGKELELEAYVYRSMVKNEGVKRKRVRGRVRVESADQQVQGQSSTMKN